MVYVVLFEPEKPANVGNIIRTCMAFDASLIIVGPLSFDMSDKALKRAGMDYLLGCHIEHLDTLDEFYLKHKDAKVFYVTRYSKNVYTSMDYSSLTEDLYLMFGRESTGIPHDVLRAHLEKTVRIPMVINARSLNLANSVAIVLAEVMRQRKFFSLSTIEAIKGEDFLTEEEKKSKGE
jgi:tRNA (cytidine/uridine-2'-O-)-methyltransferase